MVSLENICFEYKKRKPIIRNINLKINNSDLIGILGHNGAGKTTLFRLILQLIRPQSGNITVNAKNCELAYVPEEAGVYLKLSAIQNMMFHAKINHKCNSDTLNEIHLLLKRVKLYDRITDMNVDSWSNGMKKRLALVNSLIIHPKILFLDEPTNGLDPESLNIISSILVEENKKGMTILINSHDLVTISKICNRIAILQYGEIIYESYDFKDKLEKIYFEKVSEE